MASNTDSMTTVGCESVRGRVILQCISKPLPSLRAKAYADAIVPESHVILLPLEAYVKLLCCRDDFVEVANDCFTLRLGYTNNSNDEAWIEEQ